MTLVITNKKEPLRARSSPLRRAGLTFIRLTMSAAHIGTRPCPPAECAGPLAVCGMISASQQFWARLLRTGDHLST